MARLLRTLVAMSAQWRLPGLAGCSTLVLLLVGPTASAAPNPREVPRWLSPISGMRVLKGFDPPSQDWLPGHRGIDIAAVPGEELRAPADASVRFAGQVGGKRVLSLQIEHWIIAFESVDTVLAKGGSVAAGEPIGTVSTPSHCPQGCVHLGV